MNNTSLTLGSLFDGSGGFPLGGFLAGITPIWSSEVEPFPVRVTQMRFPNMQHYGDISALNGAEIPPVDIITFGSPCQDMSIAGKRSGLDGSRSSLFYEAIRIIKEMRGATDGKYPRYIVWENVPGAFSSNRGQDFKAVLEEICKVKDPEVSVPFPGKWESAGRIMGNGYSVAWRQFDAQFWGVPQRRKRIYLVADFAGRSAGKVLFESESLSGYSAEGFRAWQRTACRSEDGSGETGCLSVDGYNSAVDEVASTLGVNCGVSTGRNGVMVLNDQGGNRMDVTEDMTCTLRAESHHPPCVMESAGFCTEHSASARSIGYEDELSPTLRAGTVPAAIALENHPTDSRITISQDGMVQTLTSRMGTGGNNQPLIAESIQCFDVRFTSEGTRNARQNCYETTTARTIDTGGNAPDSNQGGVAVVYGICSKHSNSMLSDNPHSGFYEASTSRCLDTNGGNPASNQGGMAVIEGNGSRPSHKGDGYKESDVMYTLNATEVHAVAFSDTAACLSAAEGPKGPSSQQLLNPESNFVCEKSYGIDRAAYNQGRNAQFDFAVEEEREPTLVAKGPGAVCQPRYSSSKASFFTEASEERANTLVATDYKAPPIVNDSAYGFYPMMKAEGMALTEEASTTLVNGTTPGYHNGVVESDYIVRRLTPTECARLQGFPDWWCDDLAIAEPTRADIDRWAEIFETHRHITGNSGKAKSEKQIIKWLQNPHTDSAEYKMWGNGVSLPIVFFVLSGIKWAYNKDLRQKMSQ